MGAPHLRPLRRGWDLCLARTPVSEVSLQSPWPNNHTSPISSPYEVNKIKFKPDPDWFYVPLVCVCVCVCVWVRVCVCVHGPQLRIHIHKENIVTSAHLKMCVPVSLYVCKVDGWLKEREWESEHGECQNKRSTLYFFFQDTAQNQQHSSVLKKRGLENNNYTN